MTLSTDPAIIYRIFIGRKIYLKKMGFVILLLIFIGMDRFDRHLRIRITEEQFRKLAEVAIIEQRTISSIIRDLLSEYLDGSVAKTEHQDQNKSVKNNKTV